MKRYNINNEEIKVVECVSCGHQVDATNIRNLKINGIDEMETSTLNMIDSLMVNAERPCCNNPDYYHLE